MRPEMLSQGISAGGPHTGCSGLSISVLTVPALAPPVLGSTPSAIIKIVSTGRDEEI